jgi:hypothetical protein
VLSSPFPLPGGGEVAAEPLSVPVAPPGAVVPGINGIAGSILFISWAILVSLLLYSAEVGMLKLSFSDAYMFAGMKVRAMVATQPVTGSGVSV